MHAQKSSYHLNLELCPFYPRISAPASVVTKYCHDGGHPRVPLTDAPSTARPPGTTMEPRGALAGAAPRSPRRRLSPPATRAVSARATAIRFSGSGMRRCACAVVPRDLVLPERGNGPAPSVERPFRPLSAPFPPVSARGVQKLCRRQRVQLAIGSIRVDRVSPVDAARGV
jgi:hypothetical protein